MASQPACQDIVDRHSLNVLSDTSTNNRGDKKKALASLRRECTEQLETWGDQGVTNLLNDLFDRMAIWATSDIEYIREQVALLYQQMIHHATLSSELLDRVLDLVHQRLSRQHLATAKAAFVEPTEEIRVIWLDIMLHIAPGVINATQVDKALDILQLAIQDTSPDVQKRGGNALTELAKHHRKEVAFAGERPMRMILDLLHHKHSALRVIGLQCTEQIGLAFPGAIHLLFEHDEAAKRQPIFPLLVYDNALLVRMSLSQVAGSLLINVTPQQRYANLPMLVPILLSCAADDMESISEASSVQMERVASMCADDLDAAGILDANLKHGDQGRLDAGFKHAVHQCYKPLMRQSIKEAMELEEQRRLRALGVLATLYQHALEEDIWCEHQDTLDNLFTIYCNGMDDKAVISKLRSVLSVLGQRMPQTIYLHAMIPRFEEEELLHAETMCMGTKGLTITLDMLKALVSGPPRGGDVFHGDVEHVIGTLDKPYFWQLLSEDEELICETARLLKAMVTRHLNQLPLADTIRVRVVWFALVLRAASRIHHSNNPTTTSVRENANVTDLVNQLIGGFTQHVSMVSSVYGHYLPTLLKRICGQPKAHKRPNAWKTSSVELYVLEILVESITGDALENAGVTEQLVELVCYAGLRSTKEHQELGDIAVRKRALRLLSSLFRIDKGVHYLVDYEPEIFEHLLTPGLRSARLPGNSLSAYHVELLGAIAAGIEEDIISIDAIKTLVIPYISDFFSSNEPVLNAAMHLQIYASERLLLDNQRDMAQELLLSLLDTLRETSDEKALYRQRVLIRISDDQKFIDMIHHMNIADLVKGHTRHLLSNAKKENPAYPTLLRLAGDQDMD